MESKNQGQLFYRLERNYSDFIAEWQALSPSELIKKAEEISATQLVKKNLLNSVTEENAAWLLRFENPLEILRDKWIEENGMEIVHDEELTHAIWAVMDCQDTESLYALAKGVEPPPDMNKPVTVQEFLEKHHDVAFDMMTPAGYVFLSPEKAQLLLQGQSVNGHPGSPEDAIELPAKELLDQEVVNANYSDGVWHLLSDYIHEMDQEQTPMEGVTLC